VKIDKQYRYAYRNAPKQTQSLIREFMRKPKSFRQHVPLLYFILGSGSGTPPFKMSKKVADYEDVSTHRTLLGIQNCANCEYQYLKTINNKYICSQMRGRIEPKGWCKLWKPNIREHIKGIFT